MRNSYGEYFAVHPDHSSVRLSQEVLQVIDNPAMAEIRAVNDASARYWLDRHTQAIDDQLTGKNPSALDDLNSEYLALHSGCFDDDDDGEGGEV